MLPPRIMFTTGTPSRASLLDKSEWKMDQEKRNPASKVGPINRKGFNDPLLSEIEGNVFATF